MMQAEAVGGGVWHVELQRPEKRNALGVEAYTLLADVLRQIGAMPDARVVVLSGQGEVFCASDDLAGTVARLGVRRRSPSSDTDRWLELLPKAGAERAIVDGTADLQQQVGAAPRPAHLLRLVHPAVHQEVGRALGDRGADPQARAVPLGVVDQPGALELIAYQCER